MVGPATTEESWAPTTFPRQQADEYLQPAPRISMMMRPPAGRSVSHTESASSAPIKGLHTNESWWQQSRRSNLLLGATSIPHASGQPTRKHEQQGFSPQPQSVLGIPDTSSAVWPEEPAPEYSNRISGGSSSASVTGASKGIYLQEPGYHSEGRLEVVSKRVGSFEPSGGDTAWRTGTPADAASGGGPEGWSQPIDHAAGAAGLPWSRQANGDLRQVRQLERERCRERLRVKEYSPVWCFSCTTTFPRGRRRADVVDDISRVHSTCLLYSTHPYILSLHHISSCFF